MKILKEYDDGSCSVMYEFGDRVVLIKNIQWGVSGEIPKGTIGKVKRCVIKFPDGYSGAVIEPYWVYFEDYGTNKVYPWEMELVTKMEKDTVN